MQTSTHDCINSSTSSSTGSRVKVAPALHAACAARGRETCSQQCTCLGAHTHTHTHTPVDANGLPYHCCAGQNVGVVLFDVGLVTSSRAMAAGLDIPSLTFSTQPVPSSPTAQLTRGSSPVAGGRSSSPFAQLAVQRGVAQAGNEQQSGTPGTAQSISQKLVGSISQALVGALLGLETRDRDDSAVQQTGSLGLRSSSVSPKRMGPVSRSLDASPTRAAAAQQQGRSSGMEASQRTAAAAAACQAVAPVRAGSPVSSPVLSRRSLIQQGQAGKDGLELPPAPPMALARSSTMASGTASGPPMVASASDRASFSAWQQHPMSNGTRSAASSSAAAAAAAAAAGSAPTSRGAHNHQQQERMAASASGAQTRNGNNAALSNRPHSTGSPHNAADARRPSQLVIPSSSHSSSSLPNPGNSAALSPLTEARNRLRLHRPQPLPPLSHLFPPQQREGLIPVGRAPTSPGGYSQATTTGYSQFSNGYPSPRGLEGSNDYQSPRGGPEEASADYDSLLREFDAADAAGKESILFRELMVQQQERQAGKQQSGRGSILETLLLHPQECAAPSTAAVPRRSTADLAPGRRLYNKKMWFSCWFPFFFMPVSHGMLVNVCVCLCRFPPSAEHAVCSKPAGGARAQAADGCA